MTGRGLYDRYSYEQAQRGVEVDEWMDLQTPEQETWNNLATYVEEKIEEAEENAEAAPSRPAGERTD